MNKKQQTSRMNNNKAAAAATTMPYIQTSLRTSSPFRYYTYAFVRRLFRHLSIATAASHHIHIFTYVKTHGSGNVCAEQCKQVTCELLSLLPACSCMFIRWFGYVFCCFFFISVIRWRFFLSSSFAVENAKKCVCIVWFREWTCIGEPKNIRISIFPFLSRK